MSSKVDKALEKYKKRNQKKNNNVDATPKNKVDAALEKYNQKQKNDASSVANDLMNRIKEAQDAYNSIVKDYDPDKASYGMEAFKKTVESQREHRIKLDAIKRDLESYRNYFGKDVDVDSILSELDKIESNYDTIASNAELFSKYETKEEYEKALADQKKAEEEYNFYKNYDVKGTSNKLSALKTVYQGLKASSYTATEHQFVDGDHVFTQDKKQMDLDTAYDTYVKQKNERYQKVYNEYIKNHSKGIATPSSANAGQLLQNQQLHSPNRNGATQNTTNLEAEAHKAAAADPTVQSLMQKIASVNKSKEFVKKYGIDISNPDALKTEIDTLQKEWKTASRIQEGINLKEEAIYAEDFEEYAQKGADIQNPKSIDDVTGGFAIGSWNPFGEDVENKVTFTREYWDDYLVAAAKKGIDGGLSPSVYQMDKSYIYMTDDEVKIYNYHLAKDKENGTDNADRYLKGLEEVLNSREGAETAKQFEGNTAGEIIYGFTAGLDSYAQGVKNAFNFKDDYIPPSATQVAGGNDA